MLQHYLAGGVIECRLVVLLQSGAHLDCLRFVRRGISRSCSSSFAHTDEISGRICASERLLGVQWWAQDGFRVDWRANTGALEKTVGAFASHAHATSCYIIASFR